MRATLAPLVCALVAGAARADGGAIRVQEVAGPFRITVWSAPEPLRAGPADLSVLVQRADDLSPALDAEVELQLEGPLPGPPIVARATREQSTNGLLYAAPVALPAAGTWRLSAKVRRGGDAVEVGGELPVAAARPRLWSLWPYLALPPVALAAFALRERLIRRRAPT